MLAATYCPPINTSMGTLSSPPPPPLSPPSENGSPRQGIYVVFCAREFDNFTSWLSCFDTSNEMWNRVSSIPDLKENHVLKDFAMMSMGDSIFIIGGRLCRKERKILRNANGLDEFSEKDVQVLSTVLRYNVKSDQWSYGAPLNVPRYNFACTVCDDKIYVAGGQYELSAQSTSSVEVYNPSLDEWTLLPNMNRLRYKSVGVTWQGKVHVIGGFVHDYNLDQLVTYIGRCSAEIYNTQGEKWDLVTGMWQLDVPPNQIVAVEGRLYSSGDCLNAWKGHIEAYDGNLNLWYMVEGSQIKGISGVGERLYITMAPIGSHLYFLAGYKIVGETSRTISVVQRFDTSARENAWTSLEPMEDEGEKELCSHCCVVSFS
ncbi:kelch-like protein 1 [Olea europaea var. sylvestris]|uniref:kelch-like protein 1 n=1 Tax=Olea europaea var. sylvestris TaxID=158386 RepID=UPI000C1D5188|nr:kelch-like protein 1 [Olea europaea var. sylvestris]